MAHKMPLPTSKDAPKFTEDNESNLLKFLKVMNQLFTNHGITGADRKEKLVSYVDQPTEDIWTAMPEYAATTASYEDFIDKIKESYPAVVDASRGSLVRLHRVFDEYEDIRPKDQTSLHGLIRKTRAETSKLNQTGNNIFTNREVVKLFLGSLSKTFAGLIVQRLQNQQNVHSLLHPTPVAAAAASGGSGGGTASGSGTGSGSGTSSGTGTGTGSASGSGTGTGASTGGQTTTTAAVRARNPEDPFDLEEVFAAAAAISKEAKNPLTKYASAALGGGDSSLDSEAAVKIEEGLAGLKDTITVQAKQHQAQQQQMLQWQKEQQQLRNDMRSMVNYIQQNQAATPTTGFNSQGQSSGGYSNNNNSGYPDTPQRCYYCQAIGHRIGDCKDVQRHMELGWIRRGTTGRIELANGDSFPRVPGKSHKDSVENINAAASQPRKGIIPMSKVQQNYQDQSQYISEQRTEEMEVYVQSTVPVPPAHAEGLQSYSEFMRQYGEDGLQRMLSALQVEREATVNQNFD